MSRDDVIAALTKAPHGSWELTADIYEALGYPVKRSLAGRQDSGRVWAYLSASRWLAMEPLTTRLDGAIAFLLPAGAWWLAGAGRTRPDEPLYGAQIIRPIIGANTVLGEGEHPFSVALAFCIAALRARAAS